MADEEFRIELDAYTGPMDLLLYLIQKEEVDVHDIPVARILGKYLEVLRSSPVLDLDRAGEFLVMASTLLAIKSAMLLPTENPEIGELIDPREDLVRQIIEYRRVKQAGHILQDLREQAALRFPRGRGPLPEPPADLAGPPGVREATLYDIFSTFQRLLRETEAAEPRRILYDDVPMERHIDRILGEVARGGGSCGLLALLTARRDRGPARPPPPPRRPGGRGGGPAPPPRPRGGGAGGGEGAGGAASGGTGEAPPLEIEIILQDSEEGRAVLESIRARARRLEEETPEGRPKRRPPWAKGGEEGKAEGAGAGPGPSPGAAPADAAPGGSPPAGPPPDEPPSQPPSGAP